MMLLRPWLLLLLIPWLAGWWWARRYRRRGAWSRLIQPALLDVLDHQPGREPRGHHWLLGLAGVLIVVALAGPARSQPASGALSHGNLVVILDVSLSMVAEDLVPSRLERARRTVLDWAGSGLFDRSAVIVYSASAHWLMPLTQDAQTLALQLEQLDPFRMPRYGNRPDLAFALLAQKLPQLTNQPLHRLWLTDDPSVDRLSEVDTGNPTGGRTWIMPVGTEQGGPIPLPNGDGFVTDIDQLVIAMLDRDAFERAARRLDAQLLALGSEPPVEGLQARRSRQVTGTALEDLGPWLLIPALLLLLPWYRRGLVFALPGLLLLQPPPALAESWWLNAEQRAYQAWQEGEIERGLTLSERLETRAQLAFEAGDYPAAERAWAQLDSADAHYNRGNALVYQGKLESALAAYDAALALGEHPEAQYNRQLVEQALQQPASPSQPDDESEGSTQRAPTEDLDLPSPQPKPDAKSEQDIQQRMENERLNQLLNRVPPPRHDLLERRLQQEYRQAPTDDPGATLW